MHLFMSIDDILFCHSYGKFMHLFDLISEKNKNSPFIYKNILVFQNFMFKINNLYLPLKFTFS